ncbi:hypothetical protein E2C01_078276 [Portunus trituberculatus]|uniref:Uncharacterized protein n=1 Tax=Portunus trituberculatus TaxID=210409 RepID=A0A5B7ITQ4_PORTR|nr:hypothetical protein [Portunus trituberculatus]
MPPQRPASKPGARPPVDAWLVRSPTRLFISCRGPQTLLNQPWQED